MQTRLVFAGTVTYFLLIQKYVHDMYFTITGHMFTISKVVHHKHFSTVVCNTLVANVFFASTVAMSQPHGAHIQLV